MTFRRIGKGKSREEKCLWLCLCAALLISICFIALKGRKYLDSDMASEMILANLLNPRRRSSVKELVLFDRTSGVLLATVLSYRVVDSTA